MPVSPKIINALLIAGVIAVLGAATIILDRQVPSAASTANPQNVESSYPPAPDVTFRNLRNEEISLQDYRGRVVLLYFWASWCTPCITDFPAKAALARRIGDRLAVLAVSVDSERDAIDRFLRRHGRSAQGLENFIVLHDPEKAVVQDVFHTLRLPETIVIDAAGRMREKVAGATRDWTSSETQEKLEALLIPAP